VMGLFAKVVVVRATVAGGMTWLAVVMAVNTVIGVYYYLAWAGRTFATPAASATRTSPTDAAASAATAGGGGGGTERAVGLAIATALAGAVVLSVVPQLAFHLRLPISIIPG
jgi:NADH-quinone oxidoreductase subunit N